jgi:hypothetical protein
MELINQHNIYQQKFLENFDPNIPTPPQKTGF